ncbi:MAG: VanZ family protein [Phyllobacterium sp.]|uniref:VanZ family protein n=1 Tax=Phyllobacterium sp. TaxID=1871046 RepID=UPI0030F2352F
MNWRRLSEGLAGIPARHHIIAWILLALIVVATLGPISLRPVTPFGPDVERFGAFVVVGGMFSLTYPKQPVAVAALILLACGLFEYAQHFIPGRHPDFANFLVKSAGIIAGVIVARLLR